MAHLGDVENGEDCAETSEIVESENTEDEYETTDDSEWQHLIAEVSMKHPRSSSSHTDDGKTVVERDLGQYAADRRIQRKVKIADNVMIPQSTNECAINHVKNTEGAANEGTVCGEQTENEGDFPV